MTSWQKKFFVSKWHKKTSEAATSDVRFVLVVQPHRASWLEHSKYKRRHFASGRLQGQVGSTMNQKDFLMASTKNGNKKVHVPAHTRTTSKGKKVKVPEHYRSTPN